MSEYNFIHKVKNQGRKRSHTYCGLETKKYMHSFEWDTVSCPSCIKAGEEIREKRDSQGPITVLHKKRRLGE